MINPQINQVETEAWETWWLTSDPTDSAKAINVAHTAPGTEFVLHSVNSNTEGNSNVRNLLCKGLVLVVSMFQPRMGSVLSELSITQWLSVY